MLLRRVAFVILVCLICATVTPWSSADHVDQSCDALLQGTSAIAYCLPMGQEFIPSVETVMGMDLGLFDFNPGSPLEPVTVQIREGSINGPVVPGSEVTLVPDIVGTLYVGSWVPFVFDEPLSLSVGQLYVVDVSTTTMRWGWRRSCSDYEELGRYTSGEWRSTEYAFRTWVSSPYEPWVTITCDPGSGVVPLVTSMEITLGHGDYNNLRRIDGRIDVTLASGAFFSSWRAGFTNITAHGPFREQWLQTIPALGTLIGENTFSVVVEDVTPAPWNQPPFTPSGGTGSASCTVTGIAP